MAETKAKNPVEETVANVRGFKEGDHVELADKDSGFTDPETLFDISRDQVVELTDPIGVKTSQAILSGALLVVGAPKGKKKDKDEE